MALRRSGTIQQGFENIVANPPLATLTVGLSILVLLQLIEQLTLFSPGVSYFRYLVPFIPPYFITRTAQRISERRAEHDFIEDAEPYIFVAFPRYESVESLLAAKPDMVSSGAGRLLNCPPEKLLELEALPLEFCVNTEDRRKIAEAVLSEFSENNEYGILTNVRISLLPTDSKSPVRFQVNSVLKKTRRGLKWQATLMREQYETA